MPDNSHAVLGLGLAALGRPGYINLGHGQDLPAGHDVEQMLAQAHAVLDCAFELGIRYFDAARSYGRAEEFLATWLEHRGLVSAGDEGLTIASKWGYTYAADWQVELPAGQSHEVKEHSLERLDVQHRESRQLLGECLSLYQVHSATLDSGILENSEVLDRLAELRDAGLRIGLSVSGAQQADVIRAAMNCLRGSSQVFGAVQATWNLLETSTGDALQEASDCGWTVIVKEGVANGRLTDRNQTPGFESQKKQLQNAADQFNATIDAVSLAAILIQPWANVVLSGASTTAQLRSNCRSLEVAEHLLADQVLDLCSQLVETPADYWQQRSNLAWN